MLAVLIKLLSSTGFKVVSSLIVIGILILAFMEFQKRILEVKLHKQQLKINDRILAGTL